MATISNRRPITEEDRVRFFALLAEGQTIAEACRTMGRNLDSMKYRFGQTPEWAEAARKSWNRITEEDQETFLNLLREGKTIVEASQLVNRNQRSLAYRLRDTPEWQAATRAYEARIIPITPAQQASLDAAKRHEEADAKRAQQRIRAIKLYSAGLTMGAVSKVLDRDINSISKWIKAAGNVRASASWDGREIMKALGPDPTSLTDRQILRRLQELPTR